MTLGMDYPHPEGTWGMGPGHIEYLNATVGVAKVSEDDVRKIVGGNAVALWGFDVKSSSRWSTPTLLPFPIFSGFRPKTIIARRRQ